MSQTQLVATLTAPQELDGLSPRLLERIGWVEVRADLVGDLSPEVLRRRFGGGLLYTLRSREEGGRFEGDQAERRRRLAAAARSYDLVDLESERDLDRRTLQAVPRQSRLLSWHGPAVDCSALAARLEAMEEAGARYYKLIPIVERAGQELAPLELLQREERDDLVSFAAGEIGMWTRVMAAGLGSPLVYGSCARKAAAPGQPSVEKLVFDFSLPRGSRSKGGPPRRTFGIVGRPVAHSLSPRLHNGAYRDLGLNACFLPFHAESFDAFWAAIVETEVHRKLGAPLLGLSVTAPFKGEALRVAGTWSRRAKVIESANTLIRRDDSWHAESTDPEGVIGPLRLRDVSCDGPALVVGCGAAGRAAALGLRDAGAVVTLTNRSRDRGEEASRLLDLPFETRDRVDYGRYGIVVHATALGHRAEDPLPFDLQSLRPGAILIDLVYDREPTRLVLGARRLGIEAIDGVEVLLHQAVEQFRLMTGQRLPLEAGARRLRAAFSASDSSGPESAASGLAPREAVSR